MPQISFTPRNSDVYDRFSELMMQYQLDHKCKLTAPQFLDLLLDHWDRVQVQGNVITITPAKNELSPYQAIIDLAKSMDETEKGGFVLSPPKFIENETE